MSEWKETILDEFVDSISETFKFNSEPVVFLNTSDILAGKVLHHDTSDPKTLPGQAKKRIRKGDFLFSEIRPINKRYARITFDAENYVVSTKLMVLRSKGEIEPIYLEYFLTSDETLEYLQMIAEDRSGTFPQITFDIIKRLEISLPPLPEQRAIASILSSLDDKIDLLHRQNQTLEQMAETLFRQWFVEEADEGWEEGDIYEVINVVYGFPFKSKKFNEEGIGLPLIRIRDLKKGESQFYTDEECDRKFEINCGDLIAGMDGEFRLYLWKGNKSLLNQRVCKFEPKCQSIPPLFIFGLMKPHLHYYENVKVGTTVIHLGKSDLDEIRIQVPDKNTLKEFGSITNPMFEKLKVNHTQIRTLTALRDTLLPKLMSGEVRVEDKPKTPAYE